ncbi:MAG TPA: hypothetical protein VK492_08970 [Chitinophagaceae bacterium]|nr:hypothetical protein [Chitinophagaceae bacterium]
MRIIIDHITQYLAEYDKKEDQFFDQLFQELQYFKKDNDKHLLKYIYRVLTDHDRLYNNDLNVLHFHFEDDFEDYIKQAIAEFVIVYQFQKSIALTSELNNDQFTILDKKIHLKRLQKKLSTCPDGASAKNGGNRIYRNWQIEKDNTIALLKFFEKFDDSLTLCPRVIFNCHIKLQKRITDSFFINPYAIDIAHKGQLDSCVTLNTESLSSIRKKTIYGQYLLKLIDTVILFDSENSVKRFGDFNAETINGLNRNHGTQFKSLIIFSFGKKGGSFDDIREKIELVKTRFKLPDKSAYTLLLAEQIFFQNDKVKKKIPISFWGMERSTFWDTFIRETSIRDLYELRSIKMLNIYSLAFNNQIKQYILNDIFSEDAKTCLLSEETKQIVLQLNDEDRKVICDSLSNTLDLIIQEGWLNHIRSKINNNSEIILPQEVIRDVELLSMLVQILGLTKNNLLKSWANLDTQTIRSVIILAYRDQGKYPYYFNQNIFETDFENTFSLSAEFLACFFHTQYQWAEFNLSKSIHKYLDHPIREESFSWGELKRKINALKPEARDSTLWELENDYVFIDNRETIRVKFKASKKTKTYLASDLFIVKLNNVSKFRVEKLNELANLDLNEELIAIQSLDEIQESINIYDKIVDRDQQYRELKLIRDQFNLSEIDPASLWKILLKKKVSVRSEREIYEELNGFLKLKNLKIVSFSHFRNNWINPKSESFTPLSKRVFISLCEYLDIPRAYFAIMQSIKNASKQASSQSTRQMNNLLKDLFNDGCFDDIAQTRGILENRIRYYKTYHSADELGTSNDRLLDVLITLVDLISPELKLQDIESLQKIENENP